MNTITLIAPLAKKPIDYSALSEELESSLKFQNLRLVTESVLQSIKIFSAKVTPKIGQKKYL